MLIFEKLHEKLLKSIHYGQNWNFCPEIPIIYPNDSLGQYLQKKVQHLILLIKCSRLMVQNVKFFDFFRW